MPQIASPLFILRQEAEKDLMGVLERLAAVGFPGVEFLGFFGRAPRDIRRKLDSLAMTAVGNHVDVAAFQRDPERMIEEHLVLGCAYLTLSLPEGSREPGTEGFARGLEHLNAAAEACTKAGITPLYHNHQFEFAAGRPSVVDLVMEACAPAGLALEPDVGWMLYAGANPADYLIRYQSRCPVIHLKDVYMADGKAKADPVFRPTGYGSVPWETMFPLALQCRPRWLVADHDCAYGRDIYEDLAWSLAFIQNMLQIMDSR